MVADYGAVVSPHDGLVVGAHGAVAKDRIPAVIVADEITFGIDRSTAGLITADVNVLLVTRICLGGSS